MKSNRALASALSLLLAACGTVAIPAAAPTPAPTPTAPTVLLQAPTEVCGTVKAWTPPTSTQAGSITVGSKSHSVNAGTNHGATGFVVKLGIDMCLFGGLDGQTAVYHGATIVDSPFCGAVLTFTPATATGAGSITLLHFASATLSIAVGADLGTPTLGVRRCVTVATTSTGDAAARGRAPASILDMQISLWCGIVKGYTLSTATQPGQLALGSRLWSIAEGTAYEADKINPPDRTTPGKPTCLTAAIDDSGRIVRYLTSDIPGGETLLVTAYEPPTATQTGTLVSAYKYVRRVAIGAQLNGVEIGKRICVTWVIDPAGDAVVNATVTCPPGGVG